MLGLLTDPVTTGICTPARPCTCFPSAATSDSDLATLFSVPFRVTVTSTRTLRSEITLPSFAAGGVGRVMVVVGLSCARAGDATNSSERNSRTGTREADIRVLLGRAAKAMHPRWVA